MRNDRRRLALVSLLTVFGMLLGQFAAAQDATPVASPVTAENSAPVLLFTSDGMRPDFIERYSAAGVTPTFAEMIEGAVKEVFSFKPADIVQQLDLLRPIYSKTTNYGHFGKDDAEITWERTEKTDALRAAAGV